MSRLIPCLAATALVAALSSLPGAPAPKGGKSADWPQFRGPKRDNISPDKNLLTVWDKGGPKLVWKSEGVGEGFSSVAVVGEKIFTMGEKDKASFVIALDRATGEQLWATKVGQPGGGPPGPRSTPTVDGKFVYALSQDGELACLDTANGEVKWRKNFKKDFEGSWGGWNYCESPLIDGDRVVCTPGGKKATIVALDKLTGEEVWRSPQGDTAGYSSIVVSNGGGVKQYVQLTAAGTIGVAAKDGKLLWRNKQFAGNTANIPTPIVLGNQILTCAGYSTGGALLTLSSNGKGGVSAKENYYKGELTNKHGGVLVVGDYVYGDTDESGLIHCAEWKTGEVKWKRDVESKGRGSCAISYADGHLYARYQNGVVALVPATPKGYSESGSFKIKNCTSPSWSHPVVIGGKLYLREQNILWCYDVSKK